MKPKLERKMSHILKVNSIWKRREFDLTLVFKDQMYIYVCVLNPWSDSLACERQGVKSPLCHIDPSEEKRKEIGISFFFRAG